MIRQLERKEAYAGCLLGLAVGDALGVPVCLKERGSFEPVTDFLGGGVFGLEPGEWSDDTALALCVAESLLVSGSIAGAAVLERWWRWYEEGYWSCRGYGVGVGEALRQTLLRFRREGVVGTQEAANGTGGEGLAWIAPVALWGVRDLDRLGREVRTLAALTDASRVAQDGAWLLGVLVAGALRGVAKERLLDGRWVTGLAEGRTLCSEVAAVVAGGYRSRPHFFMRNAGDVVSVLEAALWAFHSGRDFREGALLAVNGGGRADVVGAVYGQLAGAYYGREEIPAEWVLRLAYREQIEKQATLLWRASLS